MEQIIKLRKITYAGIAACKKALEDANGDINQAIINIQKTGKNISENRCEKSTSAGITFSAINAECDFAVIGSISCETDFGVNSEVISDFIDNLCAYAIENKCKSLDDVKIETNSITNEKPCYISAKEAVEQVITAQIREKVVLEYDYIEGGTIFTYTHFNKRVSVLLKCDLTGINDNSEDDESDVYAICSKICLQIACCNSLLGISREDINEKDINTALDIATAKADEKAKNDDVKKHIITGYMNEFYQEAALLEQPYMDGSNILIKDLIKKNNIKIIDYKRLKTF